MEDKEAQEKIALKYCEWCPEQCQGLTKEEKIGCLAAGGFADGLPKLLKKLGYRKLPKECRDCKLYNDMV